MMLLTYEKQHSFHTGFPTFYTRYAEHVNILLFVQDLLNNIDEGQVPHIFYF